MTGHMQVTKCEVLEQDIVQSSRLLNKNKSHRHSWCGFATLKRRGRVRGWRPRASHFVRPPRVHRQRWRLEIGRQIVHSFWILPP